MAQTLLRDYLQQAEDALGMGRVEDALAHCQHILTHFPGCLEAQRLLGEVYLAQGQLQEAQHTFDWILTNDPENVVVYCDRALISERSSDFDTALDCYQQAYELSRGNSQIRQEFNQLSAKVGQPPFMFSRAGLARLYMRGDLLSQAIQEWETVLNTTPDRLDARIGLLETFWREGQNDRVEQLARQILDDVPMCLKALLLLAHAIFLQNPNQARELIQRAEALDPELVMAQELFSDLMARQTNDPFLALLKRPPAVIPDVANSHPTSMPTPAPAEESAVVSNSAAASPLLSSDPLFGWSSLEPVVEHQAEHQSEPHSFLGWNSLEPAIEQPESYQEMATWPTGDIPASPSSPQDIEAEPPTPPAWLDMLTQERRRPAEATSFSPAAGELSPAAPLAQLPEEPATSTQASPATVPEAEPAPIMFNPGDNDDMGWPEWLKSLGATTMESEPAAVAPTPAQPLESAQELTPTSWMQEFTQSPEQPIPSVWSEPAVEQPQPATPPWIQATEEPVVQVPTWMDQEPEPAQGQVFAQWPAPLLNPQPAPHEQTPVTLETLEQRLHTQGFVNLAPGSLSTIAQQVQESQESQEPTLSSALAQLGNIASQPEPPVDFTPTGSPATEPAWTPAPEPALNPPVMPAYRADALLENELETTMKRPAVRLQPVEQGATTSRDAASLIGKARPGDRSAESNLSPRERLLKGYQHQLAGDYDQAMQEYRTIIRGTPELLGEVISNVRALLKLAPKYSAGYRVLGDAYMRQGEYLQAMEAYNTALTMTKKARGQ